MLTYLLIFTFATGEVVPFPSDAGMKGTDPQTCSRLAAQTNAEWQRSHPSVRPTKAICKEMTLAQHAEMVRNDDEKVEEFCRQNGCRE